MTANYRQLQKESVGGIRAAIRSGRYASHTAGLAAGKLQANIAIMREAAALDFMRFCQRNPKPCPLVGASDTGDPILSTLGAEIDIRTDVPVYNIYRHGRLERSVTDISDLWENDFVAFALGCSFTFEAALMEAGIPLWHIDNDTTVPMFRSGIETVPAGPFGGRMVVSMRAIDAGQVERADEIAARYPLAHGRPVHAGDPAEIGIADVTSPDWGDPAPVEGGQVPVFWACGVTPQVALENAGARYLHHAQTRTHADHGRAGGRGDPDPPDALKPPTLQGRANMKTKLIAFVATTALTAVPAVAQQLNVVGSWSSLPLHKEYEVPFWTETLPANSDLEVSLTTHDQMGLGVGDVYRLLGQGVYDVAMTVADYAVADAPELEGLDVPLVATDAESARKMVEAARPMVDDIFADTFNSKVLAIAPYPPQVVFCNAEIGGLGDLQGKKVRASGRMTAKLLEALGAEGINVAFSEVPGALQKGVVDCAVTGAGSGYSAGWWEVSTHLMPIPLGGWDSVVTAMNMDKWNSLDAETQETIQTLIKAEFEDPAWASAQTALQNDIACLTGNGECSYGEARGMTLVEATDEDFAKAEEILVSEVLPGWAERAGGDWAKRWNDSVGVVVGVTIPVE